MWMTVIAGLLAAGIVGAQERAIGEVTAIAPSANLLTLKTDAGGQATIALESATAYTRVPPGAKSLANAQKITLSDIAVGDRVLARGRAGSAGTIVASSVVVMSKAEIAKKQEAERQAWQQRGITGSVTAIHPAAREITVNVANVPLVIAAANSAFRRYAPDSPRYSDSKLSSFDEIRIGDQVRALGDREGDRFVAKEIVSGSFRNLAGTVASVDTSTSTVMLNDLASRRPLAVQITPESLVRRLPPQAAAMMAQRVQGNPSAAGRRPDLHQVLEQMPALPLNELKPGDAVIVASTSGTEPGRVTAVALLAGVEPLLSAAPRGADPFAGRWDFSADLATGAPE
jgi:hypothetical protein